MLLPAGHSPLTQASLPQASCTPRICITPFRTCRSSTKSYHLDAAPCISLTPCSLRTAASRNLEDEGLGSSGPSLMRLVRYQMFVYIKLSGVCLFGGEKKVERLMRLRRYLICSSPRSSGDTVDLNAAMPRLSYYNSFHGVARHEGPSQL